MSKRILVALGGNAIKQSNEKGTTEEQYKNCYKTTKYIAEIVKDLDEETFNKELYQFYQAKKKELKKQIEER